MTYLLIAVIALTAWFLPWWFFSIWCFLAGTRQKSWWRAMLSTFLAAAIVWGVFSYYFDLRAYGLISERLSRMFQLPHFTLSFLLSMILAGILGALAGLSGYFFRQQFLIRR